MAGGCADLKAVSPLMGLQKRYTKYCCFLSIWNSRAIGFHYIKKDWSSSTSFKPGETNVQFPSLVEPQKITNPPLHTKLDFIKNLVKATNKNRPEFKHLYEKFPRLSEAKIKKKGFLGLQIKQLFRDLKSEEVLQCKEKQVWDALFQVAATFLVNDYADNYKGLIGDMLALYHEFGCNMCLKICFLDLYFGNYGQISDEHGECFYQDDAKMEQRYQDK